MDPVQSGQRLDRVHPLELLVHEHGVEQRLVESGLELLRDHEDPGVVLGEPFGGVRLGEAVHVRLRVVDAAVAHGPGESDERLHVAVPVLPGVGVDAQPEPHRRQPRAAHHHRLRLPADPVPCRAPEVLDDDGRLLGHHRGVEGHVPGDGLRGLADRDLGVLLPRPGQAEVGLVGRVVLEDVHDEPLLDGLAHRVEVEGAVPPVLVRRLAEQLQRLALGRRREGEHGEVVVPAAGPGRRLHRGLDGVLRIDLAFLAFRHLRLHSAQGPLHLLRGLARLRGVGFVDDHRVPALREARHLVHDEGELLQRRHDDLRLCRPERLGQLLGRLEQVRHQAVDVFELVDGALELPVEDPAVGDHHDLVEDLPVLGVVQRRQPVRRPRDGERLARAGGVLDEVVPPRPVFAGAGLQPANRVPLVESREDQQRVPQGGLAPLPRLGRLEVDEPVEDVQPGLPLPHLLPQVGGRVAFGVGGIPLAARRGVRVAAPVERQEPRGPALQLRRHHHQVRIDGEVDERPAAEKGILRIAVGAVLGHGVVDGLVREGVLQLGRGDGQSIDEQHEVDRIGVLRRVAQLSDDGQAVGVVLGLEVGVEPGRRPEVGEPDLHAQVLDSVSQDVDRPAFVDLLGQALHEPPLREVRIPTVPLDQLFPVIPLRRPDEGEQLGGVERDGRVVMRGRAERVPAPRDE